MAQRPTYQDEAVESPIASFLGVTMGAVKELAEKVKQLEKRPRARGIMRKAA